MVSNCEIDQDISRRGSQMLIFYTGGLLLVFFGQQLMKRTERNVYIDRPDFSYDTGTQPRSKIISY